jgi:predicted component of type VI protein secretion system
MKIWDYNMEGLKGLKGLTPEDRQNWEKSYSSQLEGLTPDQTDRMYKNFKFKEKFGNRPDYNTLKSYTPEQRDSLYNGELFQAPQETDEEQQKVDSIGKAFQQGQDYQTQANQLTELYNNWPARGRKALDEFDKIATDVSPYYKRYKGTEYLPFSDEDKYRLAAEYNAAKSAYGEQEANNILRRQMQNTASENQSVFEKIWNGFKGMGAQTAGALIGAAGMVKGAVDYIGDERNENIDNAALDFMDHVIDNDWTRYGNDVMQYGSLFDANIQEAKDNGGLSTIPIIRTTKEEQGSILDNLLSVNTIPELVNQQGFTIASMLTGAGLSFISNKAFQGLKGAALAANRANTLNNLEKVNGVLRGLQQAQQKVNAFVIPAMVGTVEGVSEGLNTKIQFLDDAKQMVAENQAKVVNDEFNRRLQNPEELSKQGYNPQSKEDLERLYKEIYDSYAPQYEESIKKAEANAAKAGVYNMGLNSMINGALNMTLKAGLQTPSVQEAMRRSRLGRLFTPQDFRVEAGRVIPDYGKVSKVLNVLQEPAGEFTEEYLQSVSDAFARGGAEYNLQNFIANKYKGDGKNVVDESLANDLFAASRAAGDAMTDKETILSGIHGALASGMGTPTINNRRGPAVRMEDESKLDYTLRRSPIVYRNPIYEAIQEQRSLGEERATAAQVMTDWIQDPANKVKYDGLVGTFNWAKAMDEASGKNDEFEYRNSELGKTINDVMMLEKVRGTDYYNSFMTDLTNAANAEDGSELAQSLVQQFKNAPNNRGIQQDDSQILETIKKNSNKLLNTMSRIAEESGNIDKMLGNAADEDTKQALIYGKMSVDSWRERATQLEDELSKVPINPTTSSNLSEAQRDALISYGTQDKINNAYDELTKKKDELKKDIENITKRKNLEVNEEPALRAKRVALKTIDKQLKKLGRERGNSIEGTVLSEADIMSLNPVDRATILNPENKSKYSEEQRAIIDNVIREGTLQYSDFIDKIEDAGRINLAQQAYLAQYNSILSDPSSFNAFTNRIRQQVANDNTRKKYEYLNGVSDYSTFVKNLDKAYRESDVRERSVIRNILKDNDNYNRYIADNKALEGIFDQLDSNEKFNSLSENDKNVIMTSMQFLTDRGVSPTNASIDVLAETDESGNSELLNYIGEVNGRLSEGEQMAPSSVEEIAQTLNDILEEYNKNITEVETINKPVEVAPTTTEDSKPPKPVGVFAQLAANPEMGASRNLEEDTPAEPTKSVDVFDEIERTPPLTRTIEPEVESLTDKFKTNSNEEVAKAADIGLGIINNASDIYNDVKEQATQILDELGDSEYETPDNLSEAIMAKANQLQVQSQQGGDNSDRASSLLKQVASKIKVKSDSKEERATTPNTADEERRNNGLITTASVDNYPNSVVGQASKNFRMNDYLRKGNITPKTPIMFIADPAIIAGVKQEMGEAYNENDHLPIMAVVEDSNGPVIIDDKKYQPIGFMPRTSANSQGAARVEPLRMSALTQQDGKLIKDKDGKVVTTNGYVRANPPQHTKAGTPNTLIHTIMSNDMDASDRAKMNDVKLSIQDRQAIYRKAKDEILPNIRRVAQDAKGERIHLAYFTPNMKGGESEFELYVTTPQNSLSRSGQPIAQVLTEGTPEEILKANSRLHRYSKTLEEFFKKKPFSNDIRFKREGNTLIAIGEGATKLSSLGESLTKKLSNYLTVPKGYEYTFIPTEDKLEGNRMYQLVLTNGVNTIPMARVTNGTMTDGTKANAIKSLILDNGNFRQDGSQPFVKWQVNYNDFNAKEGESDDARKARLGNASDIFDDNILESSRTSFKYTIRGIDINSPFKQDGSRTPVPTQVVANQVNATQGKPINTPVIVATDQVKVGDAIVDSETGATLKGEVKPISNPAIDKAKQIANRIVEDSKEIRLADDNSGYVDNNGVRYARVTSIIQADEHAGERFDPNSPWITPSTNIGTSVDEFVRDFFAGEFFDGDGKLLNDYHFDYPNSSQSQWRKFANQLMGLKNYIDAQGLTIIPRDVTVTGTVKVTDTQGQTHDIPVAGTLDLLAYDTQGNFHIFDMKTNRSGISDEKRKKYAKQVSMYQKFIEDKYGIKVASLNIIPINVSYPTPLGFGNGKTVYEISEGNQLLANGEEYMDSKPTLEEIGAVPFTDVNIQYDKLTDSEKQMITDMLPAEVEVKKVEIPDAETTVNKNLGLKMGKVKNRFAKPAKKGPIVTPSANNWESISDEVRQAAITMGYTKESWNNMTEDEKQHQKECLS